MKLLKDGTMREDDIQAQFFAWLRCHYHIMPELRWVHHIPNGGTRNVREAVRFKRMGVTKGIPDVFVPIRRGEYCGLYLEFKSAKGSLTREQLFFSIHATKNGYQFVCVNSVEQAAEVLCEYLGSHLIVPMR